MRRSYILAAAAAFASPLAFGQQRCAEPGIAPGGCVRPDQGAQTAPQGKSFEQIKAERLAHLSSLTRCIEAAGDHQAMRACMRMHKRPGANGPKG